MLEEDLRKKVTKPGDLLEEAGVEEGEKSEEEEDFSFIQGQAAKRLKPEEDDKNLWLETRRMTKDFAEDDWKKVKVTRLVNYYAGHADAEVFKAMEADPEVGIRYESERSADKHSKELEGFVGAAAGALTNAMGKVLAVMKASTENCKQFEGPDEMRDAKEKAIEALEDVQGALHQEVAPVLLHALKLCAAAANKSVGYRRKLHVNAVKGQNGRDRLAKIQPGECSLFGKKVSTLIKSMSDNVKFSYLRLCESERSITLDKGHSSGGGGSFSNGPRRYSGGNKPKSGGWKPKSAGFSKKFTKDFKKK